MFRTGQKVVCIDASGCRLLCEGGIYTVLGRNRNFANMIDVDCLASACGTQGYYARRFRPLVERKTDISIFTAMLTPSLEDMRELIREGA